MSLEIDGNKVVCEILETASKDRAEGKAGDLYEATGWLDRVTDRQVNLAADCKCPFCEKGLESDTTEFSDGITNGS